ncbi:MAG: N-acetylmuramoyl-L-alanine amidase family protein [Defluviitaleaceae bacterium]|nr:N-acetylmuramoyl-L-alanine amidase family protein [Defluviitaleaceae bacterium]MCL2262428.1 N-acetylmuramoyl-L-alanine amidase family protein [Defluviitaleaceae bacterium]
MRRIMGKFLFLSVLLFIFVPSVAYAGAVPVRLVIDGAEVPYLSAPPIILNDRTLVPVREVFERVGGVVGWHAAHRQVSLFYGYNVLVLTIDELNANLNGNLIEMDIPAIIYNDRTMVPLRFPSEVFGFEVDWDDENRAAIVNSTGNGAANGVAQEADEPEVLYAFIEFPEFPDSANAPLIQDELDEQPQDNYPPNESEYEDNSNKEDLPWDGTVGELPPPGTVVTTDEDSALARDISTSAIQTISFPQTTITDLQTPLDTGTAAYVIRASSAISEVHHFLLPDNRLVVDIHNATALISGDFYAPGIVPVSGVRASQFSQTPQVTRVVFDVVGEAEYSISLSADRTLLTVSFSKNKISNVFAHSDAHSDTLVIQGDVLPSINISTEGFPHFITVNIDNARMDAVGGIFPNGMFASQFSTGERADGTAFIRVYVRGDWPSFSVASSANSVAFMLHRGVTGVRYDSVNRELRISRAFDMNIHELPRINDYLNFRYTFTLPHSADVLGRGDISILDGFINSVSIACNENGAVNLTFNTARVMSFSIHQDEYYYVIRAHLPREVSPFIVVIDPGHGGTDPGAIQNGVVEKDMVLDVSHKIMHFVDASPFITGYMTRRTDTFVSLLNRAEFANNLGADLFISVHANAAEIRRGVINPDVHGIETWYTVGELEAAANNTMDSRRLAEIVQANKIQATAANNRGVRNAPNFVVLRETQMPAVLLELGFLTNPAEAARLSDSAYQWLLAHAIYQSIVESFAAHPPRR